MRLEMELRILEYRGESFPVIYHYYACEDSAEQFTTRELDDVNVNQVYNAYRAKHGISFKKN